jgi:hypothetical protein
MQQRRNLKPTSSLRISRLIANVGFEGSTAVVVRERESRSQGEGL